MSAVNEYVEKCLAECPAGTEELLLAALVKKLLPKYGPDEQLVVFDEAGLCLGHFVPSFDDAFLEADCPEGMAAMRRRDAGLPSEPGIPGEQFSPSNKELLQSCNNRLQRKPFARKTRLTPPIDISPEAPNDDPSLNRV